MSRFSGDFMSSMNSRVVLVQVSKCLLESESEIWMNLKGDCMWPFVRDNDQVQIIKTPYTALRFGDVAIFQTTEETFHANALFKTPSNDPKKSPPGNYIGKIGYIRRGARLYDLDRRGGVVRFCQAVISPANPYGLSLPRTIWRKLFTRGRR